jgi:synaptotagmin-1
MEELTENAEDGADEAESKQSEVKLGRLQYKVSSLALEFALL